MTHTFSSKVCEIGAVGVTRMRKPRNKYKISVRIFMARDKFEDRYICINVKNRLFCFEIYEPN